MERIQSSRVTNRRSFLGTLALGMLFVLSGCESTGAFVTSEEVPACTVPPCRVVGMWEQNLMMIPDPYHNGASNVGLAGRVYLFGSIDNGLPVVGDGSLTVEMYDTQPRPDGTTPTAPVETWTFDPDTLKRSLKRDMLGWGYTLFLPSGRLMLSPKEAPPLTRVQLKVRYNPPKGTPLFSDSGALTINAPQQPNGVPPVTHNSGVQPNGVSQASRTAMPRGQ